MYGYKNLPFAQMCYLQYGQGNSYNDQERQGLLCLSFSITADFIDIVNHSPCE